MSKNKTLRRQEAAAAAAAQGQQPNEEAILDVDAPKDQQEQGTEVLEPGESNQEATPGEAPSDQPAEGSDLAPADVVLEEGLVGDESDAPAQAPNMATREEVLRLDNDEGRDLVARDGLVVSDSPLSDQSGMDPNLMGQSASAAALLEPFDANAPQPEINPDYVGQQGFDPTLAPALEESVEDEQAALDTPESESFASTSVEANIALEVIPADTYSDDPAVLAGYSLGALRLHLEGKVGKDAAQAWSHDQIKVFLLKGTYPNKTQRNNWIYDARRGQRVTSWTHTEILDFIEGKLQLEPHTDESLVWEECFARYKAPASWTIEAFREYVCNGSVPEYTANGVLVNDRQRDQKKAGHLTYREIRAALMGLIQVPHSREELLTQYRKRLNIGKSYSDERLLSEMPNQPNEVSMDNTILRAKLDEYKSAITKNQGTQTEVTAGECQGMLYKAIRDVIKREYADFVEGWNIILDFVNENYVTLFDPYNARRGWSQVPLGKQQLQLFEDLLSVIVATREPGNRAAKQNYNLEIVLRHLPEENQRQNIFMYYQI